jgi:prophage tail gpP-like protein
MADSDDVHMLPEIPVTADAPLPTPPIPPANPPVATPPPAQTTKPTTVSGDDLTLTVNGQSFSGWSAVRFTRSCERFPSDFDLSMTQKNPTGGAMIFQPFQSCQVHLGDDLVMTGWIDAVENHIDATAHSISVSGRSKCEDLVDCSAEFLGKGGIGGVPNMVQTNFNVFSLAEQLCLPYGLEVTLQLASGQTLTNVPVFKITPGETPYEILERFAKFQGVLLYDGPDGNLILASIGYTSMASGFELGKNIQAMSLSLRFDQRYSEIDVFDQTVYTQATSGASNAPGVQLDKNIRHRRLMTISEVPFVNQVDWKNRRAIWEMNRRVGRSQIIRLKTDSWRDSNATLWQPNSYVTIDAPYLGVSNAKWIIGEVTYNKNLEEGTTAELTILPPTAYSIEPTVITPLDAALFVGLPKVGSNGQKIGGA